jgi:hypothetical protein
MVQGVVVQISACRFGKLLKLEVLLVSFDTGNAT